jgi:hypothetical protein
VSSRFDWALCAQREKRAPIGNLTTPWQELLGQDS